MSFVAHRKTTDYNPNLNGGCIGVPESDELITAAEAAIELGISKRRVIQLIEDGLLPATKLGQMFVIRRADLELDAVQKRRGVGRPPKQD